MNLDTKLNTIIAALSDPTNGLAAIKAAIPSSSGSVDLTGVNAKLDALTTSLATVTAAVTPETTQTA